MRIIKLILLSLLILMSLAAGVAKIMQTPQEVAFFEAVNMSLNLLIPFGIVQILGAVLALLTRTRKTGLMIMAAGFVASAVMILVGGNIGFGIVSLFPAGLSAWLALTPTEPVSDI
jgi:hypothetical protein